MSCVGILERLTRVWLNILKCARQITQILKLPEVSIYNHIGVKMIHVFCKYQDFSASKNWVSIPSQIGHPFQCKSATHSNRNRPLIPTQIGHP